MSGQISASPVPPAYTASPHPTHHCVLGIHPALLTCQESALLSSVRAFVFYALACVHVCLDACGCVYEGEGQASVSSVGPQEPSILLFLFLR